MTLFKILHDLGVGQFRYKPPGDHNSLRGILGELNRENSRRTGQAAPALSFNNDNQVLTVRFGMRWIFTDPVWITRLARWELLQLEEGTSVTLPILADQLSVILKGVRVNRMKLSYEQVQGGYKLRLEIYRSLRERVLEAALQCVHSGIAFVPMDPADMQTARTYISQSKEMLKHPVTASYDNERKQMVLRSEQSEGGRILEELVTCGDEDRMNELFQSYKELYFGRNIEAEEPISTTQHIDI